MEPTAPASYVSLPQLCSQLGVPADSIYGPAMARVVRYLFGPCVEIADGQRIIARGWDATRVEAVCQALDAHPVTQWRDLDCLSITAAAERANITNHSTRRGPTYTRGWLPDTIDTWIASRTQATLN